jgi:hypothetical protein
MGNFMTQERSFLSSDGQIKPREEISDCLLKAKALAFVAAQGGIADMSDTISNAYLWALLELITRSFDLNEELLRTIFNRNDMTPEGGGR